jgi:hypothetical protein
MPTNQTELHALNNLLTQADHILATAPEMPENRTAACRELLGSALALTDDLLKQSSPATSAAGAQGRLYYRPQTWPGALPPDGRTAQDSRRRQTTQESRVEPKPAKLVAPKRNARREAGAIR